MRVLLVRRLSCEWKRRRMLRRTSFCIQDDLLVPISATAFSSSTVSHHFVFPLLAPLLSSERILPFFHLATDSSNTRGSGGVESLIVSTSTQVDAWLSFSGAICVELGSLPLVVFSTRPAFCVAACVASCVAACAASCVAACAASCVAACAARSFRRALACGFCCNSA